MTNILKIYVGNKDYYICRTNIKIKMRRDFTNTKKKLQGNCNKSHAFAQEQTNGPMDQKRGLRDKQMLI